MPSTQSHFEGRSRAAKVAAIVALVPVWGSCDTVRKVGQVADRMAAFSQRARDRWASAAGVSSPSETTWALVVEALRARKPRRHRAVAR